MASDISTDIPIGALRKDALGVPHIVFFVVAAAAPLTAVVGVTPAAFMLGNGPGVPLTFLLVGVLYLLFSAGFTAMSGFVGSAGGFYSYIVAGLRPVGRRGRRDDRAGDLLPPSRSACAACSASSSTTW